MKFVIETLMAKPDTIITNLALRLGVAMLEEQLGRRVPGGKEHAAALKRVCDLVSKDPGYNIFA